MILDEILIDELDEIGKLIMKDAELELPPKNAKEMHKFWLQFEKNINSNEMASIVLANVLYNFLTKTKIRKRQTNSRIFEDIFAGLFGAESTDSNSRKNPLITDDLKGYHMCYTDDKSQSFSNLLSGNKREKTDVIINDYKISLKTLLGKNYNSEGKIEKTKDKENPELNIGSFNYNVLLFDILSNEILKQLSDRKKGLGSGAQLRKNVFDEIKKNKSEQIFLERLKVYFDYVYGEDDIYIILKSGHNIEFYFIPAESFVETILHKYEYDEKNFQKIWYRWENNNLRFNWKNMVNYMKDIKKEFYYLNISLSNAINHPKYQIFIKNIQNEIEKELIVLFNKDRDPTN